MEHKTITRSVIAPVVVTGILIVAILSTISSTNQVFAYSGYHKGHHHYYKARQTNVQATNTGNAEQQNGNTGNGPTSQGSNNTGNAAQESSNTRQSGPSGKTSGGNIGQTSSNAGNCKSAITQLSAEFYRPYQNWRISGELTCGGSGLSGKTIILTNSKLSYVGKLATVVTGEGGSFVTSSIKPTTTKAKPGSTLSAWYLGGPNEGGIASKTTTLPLLTAQDVFGNAAKLQQLQGGSNGNAAETSNTRNAAQENSIGKGS